MNRRLVGALAGICATALALTGCGGGGASSNSGGVPKPTGNPTEISGDITVLTNRTDLNSDGTLKKYAAAFNQIYPNVKVSFQAITDYAGEVKTRMNTSNYGDVLLIPPAISRTDYPKFFESLGQASDMSKKYQWTDFATTDGKTEGKVYGLATFGDVNGLVYNKKVWKQAGVTAPPTSTQQFTSDLQAVKAKTKAIPYYTNYKDGWPLQGWSGALGSATCNPMANADLATDQAPFTMGKGPGDIYNTVYSLANDKLIEPDPTTTNWENSKSLLAKGQVSAMWLGSWAIPQMQDAAKKAGTDPADIGFAPYPAQKDGKFCPTTGPDYLQAISLHSQHKEAARAWLDWFTDKSGYAQASGGISPEKGQPMPTTLADFEKLPINYITLNQEKAGLVSKIDNESEVGFFSSPNTARQLVDVARGAAPGNEQSVFAGLNKKWADAIAQVG